MDVNAQTLDNFWVRGYVQATPVRISADLPEPLGSQSWMDYRLQNRLNIAWYASESLTFHAQARTRFFTGDLVRDFPAYADGIDTDDGFVNASWMIFREDDWLLHFIPDRFYAEWDSGDWNVRVGRQRVNWGVNMLTNPNDIFNIYSLYEFDYPERPGSDAIRIQRHIGFGSRWELAVSPDRNVERSIAALLYGFDYRGYDLQVFSGYYKERLTAGAGWAGDYRGAGIKGEIAFYTDLNEDVSNQSTSFISVVSVDYMFSNGLFWVTEFLYNSAGGRSQFSLLQGEITPDNPSFSRYQFANQFSYPIHPLLDGNLAVVFYPDEEAAFVSPSVSWSVLQNLDMSVLAQFFISGDDSIFGSAGNVYTASLKYSF